MEFLNCLWLDAERGIGKTQSQTKMSKTRSFLKHFLRKFNIPGGSFSVLISNVLVLGGIIWWSGGPVKLDSMWQHRLT